ncbi:hydroxymethylbilane synthase [Micrococcoides hystricis]|uniref:Porphobilinogen deaminase n=1 Tax=Micrococcoides hystricis TaxID=1572761 RepID=A0ABV6P8B4_9MICC
MASFRVGTRGSALATTQTGMAARALSELGGRDHEIVLIKTEGDVNMAPLTKIGGTGVFVAALRQALLDNTCDVAVHSLKDLPAAGYPGLVIGAYSVREDVRDALCAADGHTLATLPEGAVIGTGSPRRAAQLKLARPDLNIVGIRGNVDTRLGRVRREGREVIEGKQGDLDAVVLAASGLIRLGREEFVTEYLDPSVMLPAPGQGALAIEARATADGAVEEELASMLAGYDHLPTRLAVVAERSVLRTLAAGCAAPIGGYATYNEDSGELKLDVIVANVDGSEHVTASGQITVDHNETDAEASADALGASVAEELRHSAAHLITRENHFG